MSIFNTKKLKVKSELNGDKTVFYINYCKLKNSDEFVLNLLREISPKEQYLVAVDTRLMYKSKVNTEDLLERLRKVLKEGSLKFKEINFEGDGRVSIFGTSIVMNDHKKPKETVIGILCSSEDISSIKRELNNFCVYYYSNLTNETSVEDIFDKFEDLVSAEKLNKIFTCNIFDSYFANQIVINVDNYNSESISSKIEKLESTI